MHYENIDCEEFFVLAVFLCALASLRASDNTVLQDAGKGLVARRKCAGPGGGYRGMLYGWKRMALARSESGFGAADRVSIVHPASPGLVIRSMSDRRVLQ
jgi:hypothetical protein